jgi:hypothetical protein
MHRCWRAQRALICSMRCVYAMSALYSMARSAAACCVLLPLWCWAANCICQSAQCTPRACKAPAAWVARIVPISDAFAAMCAWLKPACTSSSSCYQSSHSINAIRRHVHVGLTYSMAAASRGLRQLALCVNDTCHGWLQGVVEPPFSLQC